MWSDAHVNDEDDDDLTDLLDLEGEEGDPELVEDEPDLVEEDDEVARAREELDDFRASVTDRTRLRRLAAECPWHPLLLLSMGLSGFSAALWIAGIGLLIAPWTGREVAVALARLDPVGVLGPTWMTVAACAAIAAISARKAACARGASSPLLPDEALVHQRLAGELLRLKCRQELFARVA